MPKFYIAESEIDFSRNAILLDTNVLYARFAERDQYKEAASAFFEIWEGDFLVTAAVIVETWGLLVGRDRNRESGLAFLLWLRDPGNPVFLLSQGVEKFNEIHDATSLVHIDCVDAFLSRSAHDITQQCAFNPYLQIATFDFADYLRARKKLNLQFNLINPETLDVYP